MDAAQVETLTTTTPEELVESFKDLARMVDPEFRDAEADVNMELFHVANAEDLLIPLTVMYSRLIWIAYRMGCIASKAH